MPKHDEPIRVLIVEDHDHVLWSLGKLIEGEWPRMKVTATAKTIPQALAVLHQGTTDVVVLDLFLGEDNSLDHLPDIQASGAAILVLTGSRDPDARAMRIARALVSDIIAYHPKRWESTRDAGTLRAEFREEIMKSWEEYVAQVGLELAPFPTGGSR